MSDFIYFNDRIFNKNSVSCAYVQFNALTDKCTPVCEVSGSKSPIQLDAPTEDIDECKKILKDFYEALKGSEENEH